MARVESVGDEGSEGDRLDVDEIGAFGLLSAREMEVLVLLSSGKSNKEIARSLHIGLDAVKGHVSRILRKMRVASRTEAAVLYVRLSSLEL